MGEIAVKPISNVFKKYKSVIYVNPYLSNSPVVNVANTYIGGVASTLYTPALLANRLTIDVGRISAFEVFGNDIKCNILGNYSLPNKCFFNDFTLTYYHDFDGLVSGIGDSCFQGTTSISNIEFKGVVSFSGINIVASSRVRRVVLENCLTVPNQGFAGNSNVVKIWAIPKCNSLGTTAGNDNVFYFPSLPFSRPSKLFIPVFFKTNNSGSADGDISYFVSNGGEVSYGLNYSAPSKITDLSVTTLYNKSIQVNFSASTGTNPISHYEAYVNNSYQNDISPGGYITGLKPSTSYQLVVYAVDVFYNKSIVSNVVIATTRSDIDDVDCGNFIAASNNSAYQYELNDLYRMLKDRSIYSKIQAFYPFLGTTAAQHKWNGKTPVDTDAAFRLTFVGSGNFSKNGYLTNGSGSYANTYLTPSISQSLNSNGMTITVGDIPLSASSGNDFIMGCYQNASQTSLLSDRNNTTTNSKIVRLNGAAITVNNGNSPLGIITGVKQSLSMTKLVQNGVVLGSGSSGGVLPTISIWIGDNNSNGFAYSNIIRRVQFTAIHQGFSDAETILFHEIITAFETAIGRNTW